MSSLDEIKININLIEPALLESRGVLSAAPKRANGEQTYICPKCGNGTGKSGDGIVVYRDSTRISYRCFACGTSFDNIDLLGLHYSLDPKAKNDFVEICKRACSDFGIPADFDSKPYGERQKFDRVMNKFTPCPNIVPPLRPNTQNVTATAVRPEKIEMIRADIAKAQANLDSLPENARRGLKIETLREFGCGFISNWTSPDSRIGNYYETPTPRLIIPSGDHYLARLVVPVENFAENQRDYIKPKAHAGTKGIFNAAVIDTVKETWFLTVVEGEIDAMSIWQAIPTPVVAVGGVSGWKKLRDHLKKLGYGFDGKAIHVLIAFDSDDSGRKAASEFKDALIDEGIPAATHFLSNEDSKLDFNDLLREKGSPAIEDWFDSFHKELEAEFAAAENESHARQAKRAAEAAAEANKPRTDDPDVVKLLFDMPWNDVANSRRLILAYSDVFRYIDKSERWLTYDDGAWFIGSKANSALYPVAIQMYDLLKSKRPKNVSASRSDDIEKGITQWGKKINISAAIELLRNAPAITITPNDLNTRPELLNVANGTVDLTTGILYPHRSPKLPQDFITKKINVPYIPDARSPIVDGFFKSILPDEETRAALLRFLGYCTTGFARERVALFIWGEGGNGKSTLVLALLTLMGEYACELPVKTLLLNRFDTDGDKATPAIASLFYKRFAFVDEIPSSSTLDETKFKYLTGDNPITGRNLNENFITINHPSHKLILSGNHMPELKDPNDPALQDRLIRVDFPRRFTKDAPDFDPLLKDKLLTPEAQQALLALLVRNAVGYCRAGLLESPSMKAAKHNYLIEQDFISEFISENCERDDDTSILRPEFIRRIKNDCDGAKGMSTQAICSAIKKIPSIKIYKSHGVWIVKGLKWRDDPRGMLL